MLNLKQAAALVIGAVFVGASTHDLAAQELTAASWVGPSHPTIRVGYTNFFPAVEAATGGEVTFKLISGGALMSGRDTLAGLGDGVADASVLALTYNPAQLPASQLVSELAMLSGKSLAVSAAVTEFTMLHCEPCQAEFTEQNIVYTGSYATAPYALISKSPITSLEDLDGKRIRTPGGAWDRWVTQSGGAVVHTSSSEMYEAIDKGIIDVAMQPGAALKSFALWDVADQITLVDLGVYNSGPFLAFNRDTWASLSTKNREAILSELPEALVSTTEAYLALNDEALSEAADHNVTITDQPEGLVSWVNEFNSQDLASVIAKAKDVYGISEPEALIEAYVKTLNKWSERVDGGMDRDGIVQLMKAEIFDQLDSKSYGL